MTIRGVVTGGMVMLEDPNALADGTAVKVEALTKSRPRKRKTDLTDGLLKWAGKCKGLPSDLARNHDHYLHGAPKRDD